MELGTAWVNGSEFPVLPNIVILPEGTEEVRVRAQSVFEITCRDGFKAEYEADKWTFDGVLVSDAIEWIRATAKGEPAKPLSCPLQRG